MQYLVFVNSNVAMQYGTRREARVLLGQSRPATTVNCRGLPITIHLVTGIRSMVKCMLDQACAYTSVSVHAGAARYSMLWYMPIISSLVYSCPASSRELHLVGIAAQSLALYSQAITSTTSSDKKSEALFTHCQHYGRMPCTLYRNSGPSCERVVADTEANGAPGKLILLHGLERNYCDA